MRKFRVLLKKTSRNPTADHAHDLRVVIRRFRADFWLIPKSQRTPIIQKSRHDLKRLSQILGKQRKYYVALADAIHYGEKTAHIEKKLKTARKDVLSTLSYKKKNRYTVHLERAIREMGHFDPSHFCSRIEELRRRLERAMLHPPKGNVSRHQLRIEIKNTRYILEALDQKIPNLSHLQDRLGRWHDLTVLSKLLDNPKNLVEAREKEWRLVERFLNSALRRTVLALSNLAARLQSEA